MDNQENKNNTPKYSPIYYDNGEIAYSSDVIELVINDSMQKAERSLEKSRSTNRYVPGQKKEMVVLSEQEKIVQEIKDRGDYNWIISVVLSRNELDPMRVLRTQMFTKVPGGSTIDIMMRHINDVFRNTSSNYVDRARAKDYIKLLEDLGKKYTPPVVGPAANLNVAVAVQTGGEKPEAKAQVIDVPVKGLKRVKDTEAVEQ